MAGDSDVKWLPQQPDGVESWFTPRRFAFILFILLFAVYPEVVTGRSTFFYRDFNVLGYPWAHYHRECFWRGELPFWNPLNNCGIPFLAQWCTMTLYPLSLFYLLFPLSWSLGIFCLGHIYLAGVGMYYLAHRWSGSRFAAAVAGVALAFNGMTTNDIQWPNYCAVLGWMPWVVLLVERAWQEGGARTLVPATIVGALQMLAGAPELILLTWLLLLAMNLVQLIQGRTSRKWIAARFAAVVVLVGMLASIQLLPFFDYLNHSQRDPGFGSGTGSIASMPGWGWANLLVPLFFSFEWTHGVFFQYDQYCTSSYYAGAGVLALAMAAVWLVRDPKVWLLAALCGLCLTLAMGENTPSYHWLVQFFPWLGFMRYPVKFVLLPAFLLPALAAFGLGRVLAATANELRAVRLRLAIVWVLLAGLIPLILWFAYRHPQFTGPFNQWPTTWINGLSRLGFLVLTGGLVWFCGKAVTVRLQWLLRLSVLLVVWLDLVSHVPRQNPTVPLWVYEPGLLELTPRPKVGATRAMTSPAAELVLGQFVPTNTVEDVLSRRKGLRTECNLIDGIPKVNGFFPLHLRESYQFQSLLYASTKKDYPHIAEFLGVSHVNSLSNVLNWEARTNYLPLVTAGQRPVFADADETLRLVFGPEFDSRQVVCLPTEARSGIAAAGYARTKLSVREFTAHRIEGEIESDRPAIVVVAQSYYHNWRALVEGGGARLWRANHAFQALELPAGTHRFSLVYKDRMFFCGAVISMLTLAGSLSVWLWLRRRSGPAPAH